MLRHYRWDELEPEAVNPLFDRQMIVGDQLMVARIRLKKGAIVPLHSHVNEQVTYILEGALRFRIEDREIVVRAGEVLTIPSNLPHQAEAIEDTLDLDIFTPPRADWLGKRDAYLRSGAPAAR
ncbi:MAG TPA: cupin domain-containing protein [Terriglobales bacterium]|nr:cupin domain-containing protein [Terriglobales bacterium]